MKPRLLVTGAHGMLGNAIVKSCCERFAVTALHRDGSALIEGAESISIDLTDSFAIQEITARQSYDMVVHCAGMVDVDACERDPDVARKQNVEVTRTLCTAINQSAYFVYISTDQVYGSGYNRSELATKLEPLNEYGRSKLAGEQVVSQQRQNFAIVRTNVFGSNVKSGRKSSAEWILSSLINRSRIRLFDDYFFNPIHSLQLSAAIEKLFFLHFTGIINVGSTDSCSKFDFGIRLAKEFGLSETTIERGKIDSFTFSAPRPSNLTFDVQKALSLGVPLSSFQGAISSWKASLME